MNPAPTLLTDYLTPTGFGIIVAILLIVAVIVAVAENLRDRWAEAGRMIDAAPGPDPYAQDVAEYHCRGNGHHLEADAHGWHCTTCGEVTRQPLNCGGLHRYETRGQSLLCTVCGHRTALPYDQDLDGTDLGQWDREVGA